MYKARTWDCYFPYCPCSLVQSWAFSIWNKKKSICYAIMSYKKDTSTPEIFPSLWLADHRDLVGLINFQVHRNPQACFWPHLLHKWMVGILFQHQLLDDISYYFQSRCVALKTFQHLFSSQSREENLGLDAINLQRWYFDVEVVAYFNTWQDVRCPNDSRTEASLSSLGSQISRPLTLGSLNKKILG